MEDARTRKPVTTQGFSSPPPSHLPPFSSLTVCGAPSKSPSPHTSVPLHLFPLPEMPYYRPPPLPAQFSASLPSLQSLVKHASSSQALPDHPLSAAPLSCHVHQITS